MRKIRLPNHTRIFYGAGVSYAIVDQIFAQWLLYFYLPPESSGLKAIMPPILLSLALALSRVVDVITDPLMGYISDKTNTKYGRRIPYIALGTLPLSLATVAFFYPPKSGNLSSFIYLTVVGSLFFTFYTVVSAPYGALIPEIGETSEERLSLSTWQSVFRLVYSAIAMILPGSLIVWIGKSDTLTGIRGMVIVLAILSALGACFTIFGVKEKKYSTGEVASAKFKEVVTIVFKDKAFVTYLIGMLFFFVGFNNLRAILNYYIEDIMGYGKSSITLASGILFGFSALFFYPTGKLSEKYGYRKIMLWSLIGLIILSIMMFFVGKTLPKSFGFVIFGLMGIFLSGSAFIFPPAMLGDIGARISKESGQKIEGICYGMQGFFLKMAFLISISVLPILLSVGNNGAVGKFGIYLTTLFSTLCFIISYYFYYIYKE